MDKRISDEELFSDKKIEMKPMDILSTKMMDFLALDDLQQSLMRLQATSHIGVSNEGELKKRILEFIHINSMNNVAITLKTINRRFARLTTKLGTPTRSVLNDLIVAGRVKTLFSPTRVAYFSMAIWDEQQALREEMSKEFGGQVADISETIERLIKDAQ